MGVPPVASEDPPETGPGRAVGRSPVFLLCPGWWRRAFPGKLFPPPTALTDETLFRVSEYLCVCVCVCARDCSRVCVCARAIVRVCVRALP